VSFFAINLLLAFVWTALVGLGFGNFLVGFVLGFLVLVLGRPFLGCQAYVRSTLAAARLLQVFALDLLRANLRLAQDVLRRRPRFEPAFLRIDTSDLGPAESAFLAALVSLTPGSISVDVSHDGRALYVHTVYAHDPEDARRAVRALADLIGRIGTGPALGPQTTRRKA
jgi:multicomponent Na+:H+ antiporter subunit E